MAIKWTDQRYRLLKALRVIHADAADLYEQSINALSNNPMSRTQLCVGAHCIRELFSVLPGMTGHPKPDRIDADGAARGLFEAWTADALGLEAASTGPITEVQPVSAAVYEAARATARVGSQANRNARTVVAIVVTGRPSELDNPSVRRVHNSVKRLPGWAHLEDYSRPSAPPPPMEEVELELGVIERALATQYVNRADSLRSLRGVITEANRRSEEPT